MNTPSFRDTIRSFCSSIICKTAPLVGQKKEKHCIASKKYRKKYSLYAKYTILSFLSSFFGAIDNFSKKHPFFVQVLLVMLAVILSYFIFHENVPTGEPREYDSFKSLISKGFFIAPLITLMVSNQKAIVNHFVAVFFYDDKAEFKEINKDMDKDNIVHRGDDTIREKMIKIVYTSSSKGKDDDIDDYIEFTRKMIEVSVEARDGNDYKNAATLILSATALMIGFFFLLFGYLQTSIVFLLYSLFAILGKEILGIRSIVKRTLFSRFLERLDARLQERESEMSKAEKMDVVLK